MEERKRPKIQNIASFIYVFLVCPAILYIFWKGGNRNYIYYAAAMLILSFVPFLCIYRNRKPKAMEYIILLVMSLLAAGMRAVFFSLPQFKPMGAVAILTAVSLGPQAGFICGALGMYLSNLIFGNGPWTPWQIFAYGMAGFLAGILFYGKKRPEKLILSLAGAVIIFAATGFILDTCSIATMSNMMDTSSALAIYKSGIPVNLSNAAACFLALFFLGDPVLDRLERLKVKYGVMEDEI